MNRSKTSVVIALIGAAVLLPATGASAAPAPNPESPAQDPAEPATTTLIVSVESAAHRAVRTAFESIPGQDRGHITQVLKNLDMGLL